MFSLDCPYDKQSSSQNVCLDNKEHFVRTMTMIHEKVGWRMNCTRKSQSEPPRFRIATHILVKLTTSPSIVSSAVIADKVNSHATFLRQVLSSLTQAGLVQAREGRDGGYSLKVPADQISLADVYIAVKLGDMCPPCDEIGCDDLEQVDNFLSDIILEADEKTIEFLRQYTIKDFAEKINCTQT